MSRFLVYLTQEIEAEDSEEAARLVWQDLAGAVSTTINTTVEETTE